MKPILKFVAFILLIGILFYVSCKKEYSCENCGANKPPIANAGPDQVITLPTDSILLDGSSSSDPDGRISVWLWTKISGPASFNIIHSSDSLTTIKSLIAGTYLFELKVTDNGGLSAKDTMQVIVDTTKIFNHSPVANAGKDTTITLPANIITLDGSGSTDPDNNIISYAWTKISGPSSFNISNANAVQTQVTNLVQGFYQFELKVTDAGGLFSKDTILVIVNAGINSNCDISNRVLVPAQLIPIGTLSETRYGIAVAAAGNKIVFAGGWPYNDTMPASARVDIYDVITTQWTTAQLSEGRFGIGSAILGNKIFLGGGGVLARNSLGGYEYLSSNNGSSSSSKVDIYDASSNTWGTAQLSSRRSPTGASAGNKIVFAGGDDYNPSSRVDVYDLITNSWSTSELSNVKHVSQAATLSNKVFFGGGSRDFNTWGGPIYKSIDIYDASSNLWSIDSLSFERGGMGSIGANNKIFWGGGYINNGAFDETNSVEIRDAVSNSTSFECLSAAAGGLTAVRKDNKIIFFGGYGQNEFDIYDLISGTWSIGVLPANVTCGASCIVSYNNVIYVSDLIINGVLSNQVFKLDF